MADPWASFRLPEANAARMVQADEGVTAPPRAPVASSPRVWGDQEAQNAGLYEGADPWAAFRQKAQQQPQPQSNIPQITVRPASAVSDRFAEPPRPDNASAMEAGLNQRGLDMMRGPRVSPIANMAISHDNLLSAASQGTTPNIDQYGGRLLSTDTHEDDAGNLLFKDPQTGQIVPTDNTKHVALRDPADNRIKVFARDDATNENPAVGIARTLAPGLATGAVTARPAIPSAQGVIPKASDIFSTAKPFYRAFKNEAGAIEVPAETATGIAQQIKGALDKANLIPELAQPVYSAVGILEKGEPLTLDALQNIKRVVGRSFNSPDKNVRDAASVASAEIGRVISQVSKTAGENLKTADAIHSTARSVQDLQRKADVADLRTGRAGYGGNAVNSMRQVLSPIVQRAIEGRTTGFKPNEITAMREIVEGTTATNALRQVGAMAPSKGIMQIAVGGATGGATAVAGSLSNKLAAVLTGKQIERLNELVAKRSPAYEAAVTKAVDRFERAQMDLANKPGPNTLAAYISASRALSSGLTRDGIQITSGDLIRSLTGPVKTAADEQQNPVQRPPGQ